jgi:predicted DNA binding CopG/RHH family protein
MASSSRHPLIATRSSPERKARFEALAAGFGKSVSALLDQLIDTVLEENPVAAAAEEESGATPRISLRLRAGDRELLNAKAAGRGMKPASYAVMLLHAHVRGRAPVPITELNRLKVAVGELSAIGRNLNQLAKAANAGQVASKAVEQALPVVQRQVAEVREYVAGLVRVNLESWEAGDA